MTERQKRNLSWRRLNESYIKYHQRLFFCFIKIQTKPKNIIVLFESIEIAQQKRKILKRWATTITTKLWPTYQSKKVPEFSLLQFCLQQSERNPVFSFHRNQRKYQFDKYGEVGSRFTRKLAWKKYFNNILFPFEKITWTNFLVPGVNEFAKLNSIASREESVPIWTQGLSQEDINSMHRT